MRRPEDWLVALDLCDAYKLPLALLWICPGILTRMAARFVLRRDVLHTMNRGRTPRALPQFLEEMRDAI